MKPIYWRLIPLLVFCVLAAFLWRGLSLNPQELPSVRVGKPLPPFQLKIIGATHQTEYFTPAVMRGHVVLLNVWASWCAACTQEQVFLLQLAREGVAIYGLNYKDAPDDAIHWLGEWGNPYQLIGSDESGHVGIDLGVYGAPETFLIDKAGVVQYRHVGVLNAHAWALEFLPRIQRLEQAK